jgi:citrate synthase
MAEGTQLIRGLEGVVAAETKLCDLDGANGRLAYGGYDIADLARDATFEEVCYLLWRGALPTRGQYDDLVVSMVAARDIPRQIVDAFRLMPKDTDPNRPFQAAIAMLGMWDPDANDNSPAANQRKAVRLTAQLATCVAAHHRVRNGEPPIPPAPDLSHAANFLYMLTGKRQGAAAVKAFDASLTLYAEHELNASTFTTRVITSTNSDMHSAVAGGHGALKGPLHGGAGAPPHLGLRTERGPELADSPPTSPPDGPGWPAERRTRARQTCPPPVRHRPLRTAAIGSPRHTNALVYVNV